MFIIVLLFFRLRSTSTISFFCKSNNRKLLPGFELEAAATSLLSITTTTTIITKVKLQPRQRPTRHLLSVALLHLQELLSSTSTITALHAQDRPAVTKTERVVGAEVVLHVRPGAGDAHRHRSETTTNRKRCTLSRETNFSPIHPDRPFPSSTATLS